MKKAPKKFKELHKCTITTLKDQKYVEKFWKQKYTNNCIIQCQHISNIQLLTKDGYYKESSCDIRGGIATANAKAKIFDIACNPPSEPEKIKAGWLNILKEKMFNDIVVYQELVDQMVKDKQITQEEAEKMKITQEDVAQRLLKGVI